MFVTIRSIHDDSIIHENVPVLLVETRVKRGKRMIYVSDTPTSGIYYHADGYHVTVSAEKLARLPS